MLVYELPLNEVVFDFYDRLKSISKGYASFDYQIMDYEPGDLVKMQILVNAEPVDALSTIVHREDAQIRGRKLCQKLRQVIQRQQYEVAIQAAIGGRIIARETVKALRKDVTAKCYGGDITRKRKLLEKHENRILPHREIAEKVLHGVCTDEDAKREIYIKANRFGSDVAVEKIRKIAKQYLGH